jgi:serine protease Do
VDTAIFSPTATSGSIGIGFALPSNDVSFVVDQVLRYGQIRAGWIGLNAQTVTQEIAAAVGLTPPRGSIVAGVQANSPAAAAGLRDGDVILKFAAREPTDSRALARAIAERAPGDTVQVVVWREGKELTLPVKVSEWQNHPMRGMEHTPAVRTVRADMVDYGLSFGPVTEEARRKLHLDPNQAGALVTQVAIDSPSADSGFRAGDLVLRVQTTEVTGPTGARDILSDAVREKRPVIIVLVQRPDGFRWLPLVGSYVRPG